MWLGIEPHRLYAYTGGREFDARQPCVVFIHGAQHDHSVWILQSRYLAHHGYAVLAIDLPGHGRSEGPLLPSVEAMGEQVAAALLALPTRRFVIAGHSLGSLIALDTARRLAERVAGAALVAPAAPMRVGEALLSATRDDPPAAMQMINVWSHSPSIVPFGARPGNPGPGFSIVWSNLRLMEHIARRNGPRVLPNDFDACNQYQGGVDAMRALACPVLFVLGANDAMTPPKAAQALIDACTNKTVVTLANTGHSMMAENPEGVRSALLQFAQRVFALTTA
ncbi:MAG TPA: alpha/beta hydrolase [Burkholderiaceae bacterium]|nr:alpha/beta hydrolase [Burkholderiaceae bacterium]